MKLPIENFKEEIIEKVAQNQVTIIQGNTGCGKSTMIPSYLAEAGYRVLVTQPRILPVISLYRRLSKSSFKVGFHSGLKSKFSSNSQILFLTEESELIRQLLGKEALENTVLIIDEIHEQSQWVEVLLALARKLIAQGKEIKLVLMSATIDSQKISSFFFKAPIIQIPSNRYYVGFAKYPAQKLNFVVADLVKNKQNVLVFLPGKKEILECSEKLRELFKSYRIDAKILYLHSEMPDEKQKLVFNRYGVPKVILATNIAQTSITISDIDMVVDSGLEKRKEVIKGEVALVDRHISKAEIAQRMGRIGRCKPGFYYLCSDVKYENRKEFSESKISSEPLEEVLLMLIRFNIDIDSLNFFHQPERENIEEAFRLLTRLEAIDDDGMITEVGRQMCELPLNVRAARMVVEAKKYGIESDVLIAALLMQIGSIDMMHDKRESESDLIYELEMFKQIYHHSKSQYEGKENNNFKRICQYLEKSLKILGLSSISKEKADVVGVKKCLICAYKDQLFLFRDKIGYLNSVSSKAYSMYSNSSLSGKKYPYIIGEKKNFADVNGNITYCRIGFPTAYTLEELLESNELFTKTYSNCNGKIYEILMYHDIEIASFVLGTIEELKEKDPSAFHEETQYCEKFGQTYVSLYYLNLKVSSQPI